MRGPDTALTSRHNRQVSNEISGLKKNQMMRLVKLQTGADDPVETAHDHH